MQKTAIQGSDIAFELGAIIERTANFKPHSGDLADLAEAVADQVNDDRTPREVTKFICDELELPSRTSRPFMAAALQDTGWFAPDPLDRQEAE